MHTITSTPKIGIFWIYRHMILGQAIDQTSGEEGVPGLLDSPATHVMLWERNLSRLAIVPGLQDLEYDELPRGRVLWQKHTGQAIVYMDTKLFNLMDMKQITTFFNLSDVPVSWQRDAHYTTAKEVLHNHDRALRTSFHL